MSFVQTRRSERTAHYDVSTCALQGCAEIVDASDDLDRNVVPGWTYSEAELVSARLTSRTSSRLMRRALIVGFLMAGAVAPTMRAQPAGPPRWLAHAVITVWLDRRTAPPVADTLLERALSTWTRAADGRFVLRNTASRDAALVRVRFARADGIYGETAPRVDRTTGAIGSADVLIAGDVPGDPMQQRIVIYLTALHELGHALGLPHSDAFGDIMYRFRRADDGERYFGAYRKRLSSSEEIGTERATGLSSGDVAALRALYDR